VLHILRLLHRSNTAVVRAAFTISSRGVITLPARLRQALGLRADDQLIAGITPDGLLLRPGRAAAVPRGAEALGL
jgi:AbrB family looped-hinge helix DNA binding protein